MFRVPASTIDCFDIVIFFCFIGVLYLCRYGSGNDKFTSCSIDKMNDHFDSSSNNMACLADWGQTTDGSGGYSGDDNDDSDSGDDDDDSDSDSGDDDDDDYYTCSDGCQISKTWYMDGTYCDCSDCGDESDWNCGSCNSEGCPTSCGSWTTCDGSGTQECESYTDCFFCDDGCEIPAGYVTDGYCDCSSCEDEDNWSCYTCPDSCAYSCGDYTYCGSSSGLISDLGDAPSVSELEKEAIRQNSLKSNNKKRRLADGEENIYGSECDGYSCVRMSGISNVEYNVTNGEWIEVGCHNNKGYYQLNVDRDANAESGAITKEYLMFKSNHTGFWHIYTELDDYESVGFCNQDNLVFCSGRWQFDNNGEWEEESSSLVTICLNEKNATENATNIYGDEVCIYNDGSLWSDGVVTFTYNGYFDGYPYFRYHYKSANGTTVYYLHYVEDSSWWTIAANMIQDSLGVAYCKEHDLSNCLYGNWYVEHFDSDMFDEITYDIEDSMGYDANCGNNNGGNGNSNNNYCDQENSCAQWIAQLSIEDSNNAVRLCEDTFVQCVTLTLYDDDYVGNIDVSNECVDENTGYHIQINLNVSFSNVNGKSVYQTFMDSYQSVAQECSEKIVSDNDASIDAGFRSSNVTLCSNCQSFFGNDESGATRFSVWTKQNAIITFSIFALFAVYN